MWIGLSMPEKFIELGFGESSEYTYKELSVSGNFPLWLSGTLLRNGPGTFRVGEQRYRHWFDGLAMLHRFTFDKGKVSYANKFLENKSYKEAKEQGRIIYSEFATDPCRSLFSRVMSVFHPQVTDSAKVNLAVLSERFIALAETPIQVEFDPQTLESVGVFQWDKSTFGRMNTVHPHIDQPQNRAINLVTQYGALSTYSFREYSLDSNELLSRELAKKKTLRPSYIHSFGMTQNYLILVEFPLVVNPINLLLWLKPYIENFRWEPQLGTKFHIFEKSTGRLVKTLNSEAFFAFHHVNAFEKDNCIFLDLVTYEDHKIIESFYLHRLEDPDMSIPAGRLQRFELSLAQGSNSVQNDFLNQIPIEMPTIDYVQVNTKSDYRYVYGIGLREERNFYNQIVKIDIHTQESSSWNERGCFPGEAIFVRHPEGKNEDSGVLLSVVLDSLRGISFLLVLDATNLTEVARAELPHPILFGYHGLFVQ